MGRTIEQERDREILKNKVLVKLAHHVGLLNAIGMAELYEDVFGKPWNDRINDTRDLRVIITELRNEGTPICSTAIQNGSGYYLAAAGSELKDYIRRDTMRALRILTRAARIQKVTLPEYLGQLKLRMEAPNEKEI